MKLFKTLPFFLMITLPVTAQSSTEVYLFDLTRNGDNSITLSNPVNVSDNEGYDNQPSFSRDGRYLYFASTRNGQTDILRYEIPTAEKTWLSDTPGGEYSPQESPDGQYISAVRLDPDGFQRLYQYPVDGGDPEVLVKDLVIGYYTWYFEDRIVSFVLGDPPTLRVTSLADQETRTIMQNPGRSIHKIPGTRSFSYIDQSKPDRRLIKKAEPGSSEEAQTITEALKESGDMAWLNGSVILMGQGSKLYAFDQSGAGKWELVTDLGRYGLDDITRLAVHNSTGKIAVVVAGK